jgi:four helix bundle protein
MGGVAIDSVKCQVSSKEPGYKKLRVWQAADDFAMQVYRVTKPFPRDELFGLTSQLRRAALSVPTNIVEGQASGSKKDFRRFLYIANASLVESEYLLSVAWKLGYSDELTSHDLLIRKSTTAKLLRGLINSLR